MTLTDFLLARIAEDAGHGYPRHDSWCSWHIFQRICDCPSGRWVTECEVKRRVVETCRDYEEPSINALLALPYADHPDYREEWKP